MLGKETGQTNPIERLNNTFRPRISLLERESLSFSKKNGESPWLSLWYFIHDYNAQQGKALSIHHYYRTTTRNFCQVKIVPNLDELTLYR